MAPHPSTLASIHLQGVDAQVGRVVRYKCGCDYGTGKASWILCNYHEGFDDGVESLAVEVERLRHGVAACVVGWDDQPPHGPAIVAALNRLLGSKDGS